MGEWLTLAVLAAPVVVSAWAAWQFSSPFRRQRRLAAFEGAARGAGLTQVVWDEPEEASVWRGEFGGVEVVELRWHPRGADVLPPRPPVRRGGALRAAEGPAFTVSVTLPWQLDEPLVVTPSWAGAPTVATGDALLDAQVALRASAPVAARLADPAVRRWLGRAVGEQGGTIDGICLRLPFSAAGVNASRLRAALRYAAEVSFASPPMDLRDATPKDMLQRIIGSKHEGVRAAFIGRLLADHSRSGEATAAARLGVAHGDPAIRLASALALGPEGEPLVRGLASDPAMPQSVRLAALDAALRGDRARAVALGIARLEDPNRAVVLAAIDHLARLQDPRATAPLSAIIPRRGPEVAAAARRALAALHSDATAGALTLADALDTAGALALAPAAGALEASGGAVETRPPADAAPGSTD
jgi:hypothetical protein